MRQPVVFGAKTAWRSRYGLARLRATACRCRFLTQSAPAWDHTFYSIGHGFSLGGDWLWYSTVVDREMQFSKSKATFSPYQFVS
ncbi:MAG: hypothetical protein CMM07_02200 [Rhodopirellula sp.]|nr:hypothetical protein [Rhodopirellula sp.]